MSLPTAFQPENCPSNRRPTGVPTAFQPPSKGVCSNPPIPPRRLEAAFSGPRRPLAGSPANTRAPKSTPARINKRIEKR
jgi:hypothetical protein